MPRYSRLIKPERQELIRLQVIRAEQPAPHWMRVTVGGGDIDRFAYLGYDQWFRLFLPASRDQQGVDGLARIPSNANKTLGYLKYMRIPEGVRPIMRNYTVRAFRPGAGSGSIASSAEIDIDFVLHGSAVDGTAGPASSWAERCRPGDPIVLIDEGLGFNPERGTERVLLVADETGAPAVAGVCASLPADATGTVIVEVPTAEDTLEFAHPEGVSVQWVVRNGAEAAQKKPGVLALEALRRAELPASPFHAFIVGEQALPTSARRFLVNERGVSKDQVSFVGYWRVSADHAGATTVAGRDDAAAQGEGSTPDGEPDARRNVGGTPGEGGDR